MLNIWVNITDYPSSNEFFKIYLMVGSKYFNMTNRFLIYIDMINGLTVWVHLLSAKKPRLLPLLSMSLLYHEVLCNFCSPWLSWPLWLLSIFVPIANCLILSVFSKSTHTPPIVKNWFCLFVWGVVPSKYTSDWGWGRFPSKGMAGIMIATWNSDALNILSFWEPCHTFVPPLSLDMVYSVFLEFLFLFA